MKEPGEPYPAPARRGGAKASPAGARWSPANSVVCLAALLLALAGGCAGRDRPDSPGPSAAPPAAPLPDSASAPPSPAPSAVELTLLQINDVYEITAVEGVRRLTRVATLRDQLLAENPNTWTIVAGDLLSPSALGTAKVEDGRLAGRQMVAVLNELGVDFATFGNHEFDLEEGELVARLAESRFRWLSSNVRRAASGPFDGVEQEVLVEVRAAGGGPDAPSARVALVGVTMTLTPADYVAIEDPLIALDRAVAAVRDRADLVIAVTHLPLEDDVRAAESVAGVGLFLGGHEHENYQLWRGPDFRPVFKADANARSVYVHRLSWEPAGGRLSIDSELVPITDEIPEHPEIAAVVDHWVELGFDAFRRQGFDPAAAVVVSPVALDGRESQVRTRPTPLAKLIAEAMRAEAGAEVALLNTGSIRIDDVLQPGPVTQYDVIRILPFGGPVLSAEISGRLLVRALEQGEQSAGTGAYLQPAGVARVDGAWQVGEEPLDPERRYRLAISDYVAGGHEQGMEFLSPANPEFRVLEQHRDVRSAVIDELRRRYP